MRCPSSDRVGAKPPSRAIAQRGCSGSGRKRAAQTRAPDPGRLDPAVLDCLAHAGMTRSHRLPTARLIGRKPEQTHGGYRRSDDRACGSHEAKRESDSPHQLDGRSRRAARGLERARAKSPRKRQGLAHSPHGVAGERASEAESRWQSRCSVAGSRSRRSGHTQSRASTRRGKAPGFGDKLRL